MSRLNFHQLFKPAKRLDRDGFTLIELMIYVGIFSIIIGGVVALATLASGQKATSQATADVNYQGEAVLALITQTVHQASSITSPSAGNSSGSLTLAMSSASVNPTVFSSYNDGSTTRFQIQEGSPAVQNNLTNSHVTVSNLSFSNKSLSSTKGSILISFTITYKTNNARQEFNISKQFYGAATIP